MDQDSVRLGLLMETAQTHQKLAEAAIEKLSEHTQALEAVARDQIQRARQEFLEVLTPEQRTRFQEFMRQQRELHRQAQVHSERTPEAGGGTVTNAP